MKRKNPTKTVYNIIRGFQAEIGLDMPESEIIKRAKTEGINNPKEILDMMFREGIIYQPRRDVVRLV